MATSKTSIKNSRIGDNNLRRRAQQAILVGEHVMEMRAVLVALNSMLLNEHNLWHETDKSAGACWLDCVPVIDALTDVLTRLDVTISDSFPDFKEDIMALKITNIYACKEHRVSTLALPDLPKE